MVDLAFAYRLISISGFFSTLGAFSKPCSALLWVQEQRNPIHLYHLGVTRQPPFLYWIDSKTSKLLARFYRRIFRLSLFHFFSYDKSPTFGPDSSSFFVFVRSVTIVLFHDQVRPIHLIEHTEVIF